MIAIALAIGIALSAPLEDQPGWDCATMGNRICGTTVTPEGTETDTGEYIGGYN